MDKKAYPYSDEEVIATDFEMTRFVRTQSGDFEFTPLDLFHGRKKIDKEISRENLLLLRSVLLLSNVRWGLIFGTLLGAIREGDFIAHDEDTDIYVFDEDKEEFLGLLSEFIRSDFEIVRYQKTILSLMRRGEYIDFYFFKKNKSSRRSGSYIVPDQFFSKKNSIEFLGVSFPALNDPIAYLIHTYGTDWQVPKINHHAQGTVSPWIRIIKKTFPFAIKLYQKWRLR